MRTFKFILLKEELRWIGKEDSHIEIDGKMVFIVIML
jgi:hypothetical protein